MKPSYTECVLGLDQILDSLRRLTEKGGIRSITPVERHFLKIVVPMILTVYTRSHPNLGGLTDAERKAIESRLIAVEDLFQQAISLALQ